MRSIRCKILALLVLVPMFVVSGWAADCYTAGFNCTNIDTQIKGSRWPAFGTDSGSANAYVVTLIAPLGPGLRTGTEVKFIATNANTTSSTLNANSTGVITIKKVSGGSLVNLAAGDIAVGQPVVVLYNGTNWVMENTSASGGASVKVNTSAISGTTANFSDSTPAAPTGGFNVKWQKDTSTPDTNISAYVVDIYNRHVCMITVGADNGAVLVNADLGPQKRLCFLPYAAHIVEIRVTADTGTPSVLLQSRIGNSTVADLLSGALATAASGNEACARSGTSAACFGSLTSSGTITLSNSALAESTYIEMKSGTATGSPHSVQIAVTFTVD